MPIIETPTVGAPLSQGDILKGVPLFFSQQSRDDTTWGPAKGKDVDLCLILSRQCVLEHKRTLTVAAIKKYSREMASDLGFERAVFFLENQRNGHTEPDRFYLGSLPGQDGRYSAMLDFLATVEVPNREADRERFVHAHRIASLNQDYIRDLHSRMFQSFARMGFEDYRWVSDEDLKWLVASGRAEIVKFNLSQSVSVAGLAPGAKPVQPKETKKIAEIEAALKPYEAELARRFPDMAPADPDGPEPGIA